MSRIEDLIKQKQSESIQEEARKKEEAQLKFDRLTKELQQDPRYKQICSILTDTQIQESVHWLFSQLNKHEKDIKPTFLPPTIQKNQLNSSSDEQIEDEKLILKSMVGEISFCAGYIPPKWHEGRTLKGIGYWDLEYWRHVFNLRITANERGEIFVQTPSSRRIASFAIPSNEPYNTEEQNIYDQIAWVPTASIDGIIDVMATEFSQYIDPPSTHN